MADFDPTVFEHYYNRVEPFPDIDLQQKWTRSSLLARVQELLKGFPPLLQRQLRPVRAKPETDGLKEACSIKVMTWNVLSQGQLSLARSRSNVYVTRSRLINHDKVDCLIGLQKEVSA